MTPMKRSFDLKRGCDPQVESCTLNPLWSSLVNCEAPFLLSLGPKEKATFSHRQHNAQCPLFASKIQQNQHRGTLQGDTKRRWLVKPLRDQCLASSLVLHHAEHREGTRLHASLTFWKTGKFHKERPFIKLWPFLSSAEARGSRTPSAQAEDVACGVSQLRETRVT